LDLPHTVVDDLSRLKDCELNIANCKLHIGGNGKHRRFIFAKAFFPVVISYVLFSAGAADAAVPRWVDEQKIGPFTCHSELSLDSWNSLVKDLRRLPDDVADLLKIPKAEGPIDVFLFRGKASYDRYVSRNLPDVPYRKALYIKRQERVMVLAYYSADFAADVRHECAHALLHAVLPMVPLWLDEGLAKYFEPPADRRAANTEQLSNSGDAFPLNGLRGLEKLESLGSMDQMGDPEYQLALGWAHFLIHGSPEGLKELTAYLADIESGTPPGHLSQRLKRNVPDIGGRFADYYKTTRKNR
jgi:hypothetical protein